MRTLVGTGKGWPRLLNRATSSPGRFSLALEVSRPTAKAVEKRPGDEVA